MAGIEPWHPTADPPQQLAKVRVAQLAAGQFGRITSRQLQRLGVTDSTARDWRRAGYLHPRLPGVTRSGIPVMTPEQTVFDLATYCIDDPVLVRVALAQLEFEGRYDPEALLALCRRGVVGSERLRVAIAQFDPRFASTRSRFERDWIVYCERTDTPKPDAINVLVHGIGSDNVYFAERLIVELDGVGNHHTPAQIRRDRRNDRILRRHHWLVHRYSWPDVELDPLGVHADVVAALAARAPSPPTLSQCCAGRWRSR